MHFKAHTVLSPSHMYFIRPGRKRMYVLFMKKACATSATSALRLCVCVCVFVYAQQVQTRRAEVCKISRELRHLKLSKIRFRRLDYSQSVSRKSLLRSRLTGGGRGRRANLRRRRNTYMYVCVCVCVYICMYVCIYIYIYNNKYTAPPPDLIHSSQI